MRVRLARQIAAMMEKRVHEGPRRMPGCGVNDHARRLVHHNQVRVLVQDSERDRLWARSQRGGFGRPGLDKVPRYDCVAGTTSFAVDRDAVVADPTPDLRARDLGELGQRHVQTLAGLAFPHGEAEHATVTSENAVTSETAETAETSSDISATPASPEASSALLQSILRPPGVGPKDDLLPPRGA